MSELAVVVVDMLNPYEHEDADALARRVAGTVGPLRELIGALRLMPNWEPRFWGHTWIPNPFFGGVLFPGVVFAVLYGWPWFEQRFVTRDRRRHELLDRPRDNPWRTAIGVAFFTWVFTVFAAGSADRLLLSIGFPYEGQVWFFRAACLVAPLVSGAIALRVCRELREGEAVP